MESFLRLHDSDVTIPFWASVLDNDMVDPTQSVVFSDAFFGPGVGFPTTGPFRAWEQANPTTVFQRNVGAGGELYNYQGVQNILQRTRNRQILIPTADAEANFELQHGGPHSYVGGSMNTLQEAAYDPIFFSHHAFVDQIWERFRYRSRNAGVDTANDYPFDANDARFRPQQSPDSMTGFFPNNEVNIDFTQRMGYSDIFYQLVLYEEVPSCPSCNGSPYLFCNNNLRPPRCVSRPIQEFLLTNPSLVNELPGLSLTGATRTRFPRQVSYGSPLIQNFTEICPKRTFINDVNIQFPRPKPRLSPFKTASSDWVYVPVKIINKRPDDYDGFEKYSLPDEQEHGHYNNFAKVSGSHKSCSKAQGAVGKIKLVSYGLNYNGYAEEFVVIDNRLGISESTGYIPVRRPFDSSPSVVVVAAFDSCGRVCRPYCKNDATGQILQNEEFSGGFKISTDLPFEFGDSYAEAMYNVWNIPNPDACPTLRSSQISVSFFCDYSDTWVWRNSVVKSPVIPSQIAGTVNQGIKTFETSNVLSGHPLGPISGMQSSIQASVQPDHTYGSSSPQFDMSLFGGGVHSANTMGTQKGTKRNVYLGKQLIIS